MKFARFLAPISFAALLSSCASTTPVLSKEELATKQVSTLNVYGDNRVAFETILSSTHTKWYWTTDKDQIFALMVDNQIFNAKDIIKIKSVQVDSSGINLEIHLKSGEKLPFKITQNTNKKGFRNLYWVACDTKKVCSKWSAINIVGTPINPGKILTSISSIDLIQKSSTRSMASDMQRDFAPVFGNAELIALNETGEKSLFSEIEKTTSARSEYRRLIDSEQQAKENFILDEAVKMRKSARVGTLTNCGKIYQINLPMVGVQTLHGMQQIELSTLFGPSANCNFLNSVYLSRGR